MDDLYLVEKDRQKTRRRTTAHGRKGRGAALAPRERRRLLQLCVCVALFLAVFIGRGVFPERMETVRGELLEVIQTDTDFRAAFSTLGKALQRKEPAAQAMGKLWTEVFSPASGKNPYVSGSGETQTYRQERLFLAADPTTVQVMSRYLGVSEAKPVQTPVPSQQNSEIIETAPQTLPAEPQPVYTGPPLPDNATTDRLSLGLQETAAPVMAPVSSGFGWREHPIEGGEKFHAGVDLAADYGTPIGAFAAGTVDYIGESDAYGQYLQIRHTGGVTSFYAHCSQLCVQQGQTVKKGEKIAEVGDTGETTGAHLHFELKCNGELVNPVYYIETE